MVGSHTDLYVHKHQTFHQKHIHSRTKYGCRTLSTSFVTERECFVFGRYNLCLFYSLKRLTVLRIRSLDLRYSSQLLSFREFRIVKSRYGCKSDGLNRRNDRKV